MRRIDLYTDDWTKLAKNQEGDEPENLEDANVEQALKGFSISVNALKQASLTINQIHFFIDYLNDEVKQLNFVESREHQPENKQAGAQKRYQNNSQTS